MTHEELFLREGAFYFGQRLIYKQKDVGMRMAGSQLQLNADGEDLVKKLADIEDVEVKVPKKPKVKKEEPAEPASLDDLLDE